MAEVEGDMVDVDVEVVEEVVELEGAVPMLAQGFAPSFKAIAGDGSGEAMVAAAAAK